MSRVTARWSWNAVMFIAYWVIGAFILLVVVGTIIWNWRLNRIIAEHRLRAVAEPDDEVVRRAKRLVGENRAMSPDDIFMSMSLLDDLGIDGDDAVDVFEAFAKEFPDVDLSRLDLSLHFGPEGVVWPWAIAEKLLPVRVGDLVQAARTKRWVVPGTKSANMP